jgi:hypothetical protein
MAVALHVVSDDGAVEDVEGGEQRGCAVTFVVMRHGAGAARLLRQSLLGAIERLNLAHMGICGSRCSDQDSMVNLRSLLGYPRSEPVCMAAFISRTKYPANARMRHFDLVGSS